MKAIDGIHHVTAYASDPQRNYDFMTDVLGLRFVRQTLLYMPGQPIYHLYYGDRQGTPGTVLTYFPGVDMPEGQVGKGDISSIGFTIPRGSVDYWTGRLEEHDIATEVTERFDETAISFTDPDGLPLELVTGDSDIDPWTEADVPAKHGIRGIHDVAVTSADPAGTFDVLETMGWERLGRYDAPMSGDRIRFTPSEPAGHGRYLDVVVQPNLPSARKGIGMFVHVAFRVANEWVQQEWSETLRENGYVTTSRKYRQEFRSMYLTEPGGATFEYATDGPGFTEHEDLAELGGELQIPKTLREAIDVPVEELKQELPEFEPR